MIYERIDKVFHALLMFRLATSLIKKTEFTLALRSYAYT